MTAIRSGRTFTLIDAIAAPGYLGVESDQTGHAWVDYAIPDGGELFMVRRGHDSLPLQEGQAGRYHLKSDDMTGVVRFEVRIPGALGSPPVPWIVSNPIYFVPPFPTSQSEAVDGLVVRFPADIAWHSERESKSAARVASSNGQVILDCTLAAGERNSQFAAAVGDIQGRALMFSAVLFSAVATKPGRLSVQLRYGGEKRWAQSVYVDDTAREVRVTMAGMVPVDFQKGPAPDSSTADSLLFVIDLTNARPGDSNTVRITNLRLVK